MLSPTIWLGLSQETRRRIALQFNLQKSAGVEVVNSTVVSDGYTAQNLSAISLERLQTLFKTDSTDFYVLFDKLVSLIEKAPQIAKSETVGSPGITIPPFEPVKTNQETDAPAGIPLDQNFGIQELPNEPIVLEVEPVVEPKPVDVGLELQHTPVRPVKIKKVK